MGADLGRRELQVWCVPSSRGLTRHRSLAREVALTPCTTGRKSVKFAKLLKLPKLLRLTRLIKLMRQYLKYEGCRADIRLAARVLWVHFPAHDTASLCAHTERPARPDTFEST